MMENTSPKPGLLLRLNRSFSGVLDWVGVGNAWDVVGEKVKSGTRLLTQLEVEEARRVFGEILPYEEVRVDENSSLASLGAWMHRTKGMGFVVAHTIHFNRVLTQKAGHPDLKWLMHELTHVLQYKLTGMRYLGEALHAQATTGYQYGGPKGLPGKNLADFNREQQADIVADYYYMVLHGTLDPTPYEPLIRELREGKI
ncbi:MAG: hypothetical protein H6581_00505 [Bacteroidia bacterium]|nr:hypothetical protein [Bacteroidia bacterium]